MNLETIPWVARFPALVPRLAVARDKKASQLAHFLQKQPRNRLQALRGACYKDFFFVLGDREHLPWIDGIEYLGVSPHSPGLYVPVNLMPGLDESVYGRVIKKHFLRDNNSLGIAVNPLLVFSLAATRELSGPVLPDIISIIEGNQS